MTKTRIKETCNAVGFSSVVVGTILIIAFSLMQGYAFLKAPNIPTAEAFPLLQELSLIILVMFAVCVVLFAIAAYTYRKATKKRR